MESICFSVRGAKASVRRSHNDNFSLVSLSVGSSWNWSVDAIASLYRSAPTSAAAHRYFLFRERGRSLETRQPCSSVRTYRQPTRLQKVIWIVFLLNQIMLISDQVECSRFPSFFKILLPALLLYIHSEFSSHIFCFQMSEAMLA